MRKILSTVVLVLMIMTLIFTTSCLMSEEDREQANKPSDIESITQSESDGNSTDDSASDSDSDTESEPDGESSGGQQDSGTWSPVIPLT